MPDTPKQGAWLFGSPLLTKIATYGLCGIVVVATDFPILHFLLWRGIPDFTANTVSRTFGLVACFLLNKRLTFKSPRFKFGVVKGEMTRFIVMCVISYGLSSGLFVLLARQAQLHWLVRKVIAEGVTLAFNFTLMYLWVFRRRGGQGKAG